MRDSFSDLNRDLLELVPSRPALVYGRHFTVNSFCQISKLTLAVIMLGPEITFVKFGIFSVIRIYPTPVGLNLGLPHKFSNAEYDMAMPYGYFWPSIMVLRDPFGAETYFVFHPPG